MVTLRAGLFWAIGIFLSVAVGCNQQNTPDLPVAAEGLEDLTVYAVPVEAPHTIQLERQVTFGDENELVGSVTNVAVDAAGNVYIGDNTRRLIHKFDPSGNFVTAIGGEGSGPGEFRLISQSSIHSDQLYVYDPLLLRMSIYSLEPLELDRTLPMSRNRGDELSRYRISRLLILDEETFLVGFSAPVISDPSHPHYNLVGDYTPYFLVDAEGEIVSEEIFKKESTPNLVATVGGELRYTAFEFSGSPLITTSGDGYIYTARTSDFLIKKYDSEGAYLKAYYYDIYREKFDVERALSEQERWEHPEVVEHRQSVIRRASDQLPDSWPVLNSMIADDENRLWVSTVVEDKGVYEWWVLDPEGSLIARFSWPRNRRIAKVNNGHFYAIETDEQVGTAQVVRYLFEIN